MRNLNGSNIQFAQDERIFFEALTHTYSVIDIGTMKSVTQVIQTFFEEFKAEYWSLRKCNGDKQQAAELRDKWACKAKFASQIGTHLHEQIEHFLNTGAKPMLHCDIAYEGEYIYEKKTVSIEKEWKMYMKFHHQTHYQPFRTEWAVYDEDTRIAGTIDLICAKDDGTYELYDWKRSNKVIPHQDNRFSHGQHGLEHLPDTSYQHYCLQQNMYRHIVEKNYGLTISAMHLVVLHPEATIEWNGNIYTPAGQYRIIDVPKMEREIDIIFNQRQEELKA